MVKGLDKLPGSGVYLYQLGRVAGGFLVCCGGCEGGLEVLRDSGVSLYQLGELRAGSDHERNFVFGTKLCCRWHELHPCLLPPAVPGPCPHPCPCPCLRWPTCLSSLHPPPNCCRVCGDAERVPGQGAR